MGDHETHAPYEAPFPHNSQAPDHGVQVVGGRDIVFSNVHVKNARMDGFFTHYATDGEALVPERVTFLDCSAIGCGRIGFAGDWGHELRLVRCVATDNGRDIVIGEHTYPAVVAGPADGAHFEAWWGTAVEVPGHRQIVVEQCTFRENGGRGVALTGHMMADGLIVRDCLFEENGRRTSYYHAKSGGGFHWAEVGSAHVLVSGAGATISGCSFLPISTVALGRDENEQPVNVEQVAMVWLTVNAHREDPNSQRPLEAWRRAGHRVVGNRFVGAHGGAEDLLHAWRPAVEVVAQVDALSQPISEDGGSVVAENHFSRCWNAVTFRAPRGVFRGNTVIEGLNIAGASAHQAAMRAYNYASQCRVDQNLFVDVASRVVHLGDTPATEGGEDVSDFWFTDNIVRYDNATLLHDAAVELMASSNARSRLIGNLFIRDDFTPKKAAIRWNTTSNPSNMPQGIVMHGNVARGAGWTSTTSGAAVWSMVQPAWLSRVIEASGNQPPLPGEAVTQPGRGLRLTAPDTNLASAAGTLWLDALNVRPMFTDATTDRRIILGQTSATPNTLVRYEGTDDSVVKPSTVTLSDANELLSAGNFSVKATNQLDLATGSGDVTVQPSSTEWARFLAGGGMRLKGRASAPTGVSGEGILWTTNASEAEPRFRTPLSDRPVVRGPTSATDNRLARFDGTSGGILQHGTATLDDSGNLILAADGKLAVGSTARFVVSDGTYGMRLNAWQDLRIQSEVQDISLETRVNGSASIGSILVKDSGTQWAIFEGPVRRFGVGTSAPSSRLHAEDSQSGTVVARVVNTSTSSTADTLRLSVGATTPGTGNWFVGFYGTGNVGFIRGDGSGGVTYGTVSDAALKQDVTDAPALGDVLDRLRVREYAWKRAPGERRVGFIAQELHEAWPEAAFGPGDRNARKVVRLRAKGAPEGTEPEERLVPPEDLQALQADTSVEVLSVGDLTEDHPEYAWWGVDLSRVVPLLVKVAQEQRAENAELKRAVAGLLARVEALERR